MYAIGLMSGTSLDGIDAVLCEITGSKETTSVEQLGFVTVPYSNDLVEKIKASCDISTSDVQTICSLNFELGKAFSKAVTMLLEETQFDKKIDFIATHGQTIYHLPHANNKYEASTLQIGEPAILAYDHHTKVISNFRVMDIAAKGEGAPMVPYSEYILYNKKNKTTVLQNIGGIGNVTILPAKGTIEDVYAFDTGPGNMMIDEAMKQLYNKNYDKSGETAAKGQVIEELLQKLLSNPYINKIPPKTTGREMFGKQYITPLIKEYKKYNKEDIITTLTKFTALTIALNYKMFIMNRHTIDTVIIGGGGAHNTTLLNYIKEELEDIEVITQEEAGYSSDSKEAIAFVILGNETLHGNSSNIKLATGAKHSVILGNITPNPWGGN
ncbi:MAG: anhydro-N-acetylmuramic acid kinase AnmK [Erysipelotrichaceae bacterium]